MAIGAGFYALNFNQNIYIMTTAEKMTVTREMELVVRVIAQKSGSPQVGWKRIAEILGLPDDVDGREHALGIFDAMIDADMVVKGVLVRESAAVQEILATVSEPVVIPATVSAPATLVSVPMGQVVVCPLNPRKVVDEAGIEEMALSILEHGIIQPPIARPGRYEDTWEVVYGQRRLLGKRRANAMTTEAGGVPDTTIQLLVREIDDRTVVEEGWVENLQRVDVGVREEVTGFRALLDLRDDAGEPVYTVSSLARRLGKVRQFVSQRLALADVPEEMWTAHEDGLIGVRQMELVGRLPDEASRKRAAAMVLKPQYRTAEEPLTVRETEVMLSTEFMTSLRGCAWELSDAELVPVKRNKKGERVSGGACQDCPWRTGSAPELQGCLSSNGAGQKGVRGSAGGKRGIDANSCMQPACYKAKQEAAWAREMREASEAGARVLSSDEAGKVFAYWAGDRPVPQSGYVSLSESPGFPETGHHAGPDTLPIWAKMIGKTLPAEDLVVARNEATGSIVQLVPREVAIELAEAAMGKSGVDSPFANRPGAKKAEETEETEEVPVGDEEDGVPPLWKVRSEVNNKLEGAIIGRLSEFMTLQRDLPHDFLVELILRNLHGEVGYGGLAMEFCKARGIPEFEQSDEVDMNSDEQARAWLDEVLRPEVMLSPSAWAAMVLICVTELDFSDVSVPDLLLSTLGLDRDAVLEEVEDGEGVEA